MSHDGGGGGGHHGGFGGGHHHHHSSHSSDDLGVPFDGNSGSGSPIVGTGGGKTLKLRTVVFSIVAMLLGLYIVVEIAAR
jgi:hypothetical protein